MKAEQIIAEPLSGQQSKDVQIGAFKTADPPFYEVKLHFSSECGRGLTSCHAFEYLSLKREIGAFQK
jgi:hypothetical protein